MLTPIIYQVYLWFGGKMALLINLVTLVGVVIRKDRPTSATLFSGGFVRAVVILITMGNVFKGLYLWTLAIYDSMVFQVCCR